MENKKKIMIIISIIVTLLLGLGIAYALFIYNKTAATNEQLVTGDIYMHYLESNTLTLEGAFPRNTYDPNVYFQFSVDGKNTTTNHDIYYDIQITRGAVPDGKIETNRILDKFVRFRLVSVSNGNESVIFNNWKYNDLVAGKRVYVTTIPKNTMTEISHVYRLYMWIGDDIKVANTDYADKDYDINEWNNIFASIKVNVTGDFEPKEVDVVATDASCFTSSVVPIYTLNDLTDSNNSSALASCVDYIGNTWNYNYNLASTPTEFCQGTGTYSLGSLYETFQELLDYDADVFSASDISYFLTNNIITSTNGVMITDYDTSCGLDVVIPATINNVSVLKIGWEAFFEDGLTSLVLPNTLKIIEKEAFSGHRFTSVTIPSNVRTIGGSSFSTGHPMYGGTVYLENVVNKTGRAFNWGAIIIDMYYEDETQFVSGTLNYGTGEVVITTQ